MTIYDIDERIRKCEEALTMTYDEDTGEITDELMAKLLMEELDRLDIDRKKKIEGACMLRLEVLDGIEVLSKEIKRMQAALDSQTAREKRLKNYIECALDGDKFKTPKVSVYYGTSNSVDITDEKALPAAYLKTTVTPMKDKIKAALSRGGEVPGARIEESHHIVIRYPKLKERKTT